MKQRNRAINIKKLSDFGRRVEIQRIEKGISREKLIDELNITMKTYTSWLSNDANIHHSIKLQDLVRLCDVLDCDVDWMIGRLKEENHNIKYICEQTGLSALAVKRLIDWNNGIIGSRKKYQYINNENANINYVKTLNRLLTCENVEKSQFLLSDIADYFFAEEIQIGMVINKNDPNTRFTFDKLSDVAILQGELSYRICADDDIKIVPEYHNHTGHFLSVELLKEVAIKEIQKDLDSMIDEKSIIN